MYCYVSSPSNFCHIYIEYNMSSCYGTKKANCMESKNCTWVVNKGCVDSKKQAKQYKKAHKESEPKPKAKTPTGLTIPESFSIRGNEYFTTSSTDAHAFRKVLKKLARGNAPSKAPGNFTTNDIVIGRDGNKWYIIRVYETYPEERYTVEWKQK